MSGALATASLDAAARIARLRAQNPQAAQLARLLSLAVPIEPALMREMRLKLMPGADVGAEVDLWFSGLVETRSREGIMLLPSVAEELRKGLALFEGRAREAADAPTLAARCFEITRELHDYLPPAVQLEEELNYLSLDAAANEAKIKDLVTSALMALVRDGREEVANWAGRALPRLSAAVRDSGEGHMLAAASDLRLGRSLAGAPYLADAQQPIPSWFARVLPSNARKVPLGVSLAGTVLRFDPTASPSVPHIMVPETHPRVVQVSENDGKPQIVFIDARAAESISLSSRGVIALTTLAGDAYRLERIDGDKAVAGLACTAYADCNQALICWQIAAPPRGLLGFAVARVDANGDAEVLGNALGFSEPSATSGLQPSTAAPIQRFLWIDRPPRRGASYRYRITPMIGAPGKLVAVESLEARTSPVTVAVKQDGSVTALFNRAPGVASAAAASSDNEQALRESLGGEVRRALLALLEEVAQDGAATVFVALSRLDDADLINVLARIGRRASIILGAARLAREGGQLAAVRKTLAGTQLYPRAKAPGYPHNHFMVVARGTRPRLTWTGSMSWTAGALYSRDASVLLIEDEAVASRYLQQWQALSRDPPGAPLMAANAAPNAFALADGTQAQLWFAPQRHAAELEQVRACIHGARIAILFALGPRGPTNSVLEDIIARGHGLYVAGIARAADGKRVGVYQHGRERAVTPERGPSRLLDAAGLKSSQIGLPIGSRLIVIDPFGDDPVVIAGSHALSAGASRRNDEDLLIIRRNRALAAQCAVHVKGLIDHYAFRALAAAGGDAPVARALAPDESWQKRYQEGEAAREILFWMGALAAAEPAAPPAPTRSAAPSSQPRKKAAKKKAAKKKAPARAVKKKSRTAQAKPSLPAKSAAKAADAGAGAETSIAKRAKKSTAARTTKSTAPRPKPKKTKKKK